MSKDNRRKFISKSVLTVGMAPAAFLPAAELPPDFQIEQGPAPNPWNHLNFHNNPRNFQFAIVADLTGRERPGVFKDAVKKLNLLQPEFAIGIGDYIEGHTNDAAQLNRDWDQFQQALAPLEMPFFFTPGNHDYWYATTQNWDGKPEVYDMRAVYKQRIGRSYYHFLYHNVLFLILNNSMGDEAEMAEQKEYVTKVLSQHKNVRWTFTFFHYPSWFSKSDVIWQHTAPLLADRPFTAFAGNAHHYVHYERNNRDHILIATTGGMSGLRGLRYGEIDHVLWITMRDDGPRIANLLLDGIQGKSLRTERSAALSRILLDKPPVSSPVVFQQPGEFQPLTTAIRVMNRSDCALQLTGNFQPHQNLVPEPATLRVQVPPKSEQVVNVSLRSLGPTPVQQARPLILNWTASQEPSEKDPIVRVDGKLRIVVDTHAEQGSTAKPVFVDQFTGDSLAPGWVTLGPGGYRSEGGRYTLSDDPSRPDSEGCEYTDGRGIYTLTPVWHLPLAGLYRDVPPDSFDCRLQLTNVEWGSDAPFFRWEFWDSPDAVYNYGPSYRTGVILQLTRRSSKGLLQVVTFDKLAKIGKADPSIGNDFADSRWTLRGEVELPALPSGIGFRAKWRESSRSWAFAYGLEGAEPDVQIPVGAFRETTSPSPEGKRNLIYVRKAGKGFRVSLSDYALYV